MYVHTNVHMYVYIFLLLMCICAEQATLIHIIFSFEKKKLIRVHKYKSRFLV